MQDLNDAEFRENPPDPKNMTDSEHKELQVYGLLLLRRIEKMFHFALVLLGVLCGWLVIQTIL